MRSIKAATHACVVIAQAPARFAAITLDRLCLTQQASLKILSHAETQFMCCVQYVELAFTLYEQYFVYAGALLAITLVSGFVSTLELYSKRLQLYRAMAQRHVVPIVQAGRVRYVTYVVLYVLHTLHPCCKVLPMYKLVISDMQ